MGVSVRRLEGEDKSFSLRDRAELPDEGLGLTLITKIEKRPSSETALIPATLTFDHLQGRARFLPLLCHQIELMEVKSNRALDHWDRLWETGGTRDLRIRVGLRVYLEITTGLLHSANLTGVEDIRIGSRPLLHVTIGDRERT